MQCNRNSQAGKHEIDMGKRLGFEMDEVSLIYSIHQPTRCSSAYYRAANISSFRPITYTTIMKFVFKALICTSITVSSLHAGEEGFVSLFDGETLNGWKAARSTGEGDSGAFSVNKDEKAIHVYAGQEHGSKQKSDCLNTEKEYSHYILKLEYKWEEKRFAPRVDWDRDAGLLFHVHGDLTKVWPASLEMQIGESPADKKQGKGNKGRFHTGDLFVLGKGLSSETARDNGYWGPKGEVKRGRSVKTLLGVEKPKGEWNEMEIQVHGSKKAVFILNGEVVLETANFVKKNKEGETVPLEKGRIGFQAEWAELMYRNIRIKELPSK